MRRRGGGFAGRRQTVWYQRHVLRSRSSVCGAEAPSAEPKFRCPRQESNLVYDLRKVACDPPHSEDGRHVVRGELPSPGIEPGPRPSEGRMRTPSHPEGFRSRRFQIRGRRGLRTKRRRTTCSPWPSGWSCGRMAIRVESERRLFGLRIAKAAVRFGESRSEPPAFLILSG